MQPSISRSSCGVMAPLVAGLLGLVLGAWPSPTLADPSTRPSFRTVTRSGAQLRRNTNRRGNTTRPLRPVPNRTDAAERVLAGSVGLTQAKVLRQNLSPQTLEQLAKALPRVQRTPQGQELTRQLATGVGALAAAQNRVKSAPLKNIVNQQIRDVGTLSLRLLQRGLQTRTEPIRGSERRGRISSFIAEDRSGNAGLSVIRGGGMTSVGVHLPGREQHVRLSRAGVTHTLNNEGTKEVTENVLPNGKIVWTHTQYTMDRHNPGKPTRVQRSKSFVDHQGKTIPFEHQVTMHEQGSPPHTTSQTVTRMKVEDRSVNLP